MKRSKKNINHLRHPSNVFRNQVQAEVFDDITKIGKTKETPVSSSDFLDVLLTFEGTWTFELLIFQILLFE